MRIVVGQGSCGIATGAKKTSAEFERILSERGLDIPVEKTGCIGACYMEPIVDIYSDDDKLTRYVKVQPERVEEIIEKHIVSSKPVDDYTMPTEDMNAVELQKRVVLRNCGLINPEVIEEYLAKDGYKATEKVVTSMTKEEVIDVIKVSGLRGRGGAGFPTWFKWNAAKNSLDRKSVV